jgi:hypothetical protein
MLCIGVLGTKHSRCFASAFLTLRTAAEGRLCSPRWGEVEQGAQPCVIRSSLPPAAPAITLVEVSKLYGADFLIEIEAIAAL